MSLKISENVRALGQQAQGELGEQFARIDAVAEENTQKVLAAFPENIGWRRHILPGPPATAMMTWGRDQLDAIFADLFGTEDALVRIGFRQRHPCDLLRPVRGRCGRERPWSLPWGLPTIPFRASSGSPTRAPALSGSTVSSISRWT